LMADDDEQAMIMVRELLSFIPSNNMEEAPLKPSTDPIDREDEHLRTLIPVEPNKPYDMKELITAIIDHGNFFEIQPYFALNIIVGYGRIGGKSIGIVANQPGILAGVLDIDSSLKAARFVRFC